MYQFESPFLSREAVLGNELAIAIYDGFPVSEGHMLIIPRRVFADYFDATPEEREALWMLVSQAKIYLEKQFHPDGYNVGINSGAAAGQTVFHMHIHLIPRYEGDTPNPRGGVRGVIPGKQSY